MHFHHTVAGSQIPQFNGRCHRQEVVWNHFACYNTLCCSISVLQAEKAEGYIDLTNFTVDRAIECKKKQ